MELELAGSTGSLLLTSPGKRPAEGPWRPPLDPLKERPLSHHEPADSQRRLCGPPAEEGFPVDTTLMQQFPEGLCELKRDQHDHTDTSLGGAEPTGSPPWLLAVAGARSSQEVLFGFAFQPMGKGLEGTRAVGGSSLFPLTAVSSARPPIQPALHRSPACLSLPFLPWRQYFCPILFWPRPSLTNTNNKHFTDEHFIGWAFEAEPHFCQYQWFQVRTGFVGTEENWVLF